MSGVGILTALAAGLLSFLSPCVLPLIPAYLSLVSGYGLADIRSGTGRFRVLARTLAFAAGFTLVFTILGLLFSGASLLLGGLSRTITLVAGLLVILLGLNMVFDFLKFLDLEARFHAARKPKGYAGAFLVGMAFAAGWSPCVGPILASILLYAAREGNALRSVALLLAYSLGLAAPFILAGLFFDRLTPLLAWFKRRARGVRVASGLLLVALGALMALGRLTSLNSAAVRGGDALRSAIEASPEPARFIAAAAWGLAAAATLAAGLLRGRAAEARRGSGARRSQLSPARIAFAAAFLMLALGDLAKLWSTPGAIVAWLSFQGA